MVRDVGVHAPQHTDVVDTRNQPLEKISLTSIPDWPYLLKLKGDFISVPVRRSVLISAAGGFWPLYLVSAGLGSNVSTCDGPPFMNRWMTCLVALDGDGFGASGLVAVGAPRRPWSLSTAARPSVPKPVPVRWSISRREGKNGECIDRNPEKKTHIPGANAPGYWMPPHSGLKTQCPHGEGFV